MTKHNVLSWSGPAGLQKTISNTLQSTTSVAKPCVACICAGAVRLITTQVDRMLQPGSAVSRLRPSGLLQDGMAGLNRLKDALQHAANKSQDAERMAQQLLGLQQQLAQGSKEVACVHVSNISSALASCFSRAPARTLPLCHLHSPLLFLRMSGRHITYLPFPASCCQGPLSSSPALNQFAGHASWQRCLMPLFLAPAPTPPHAPPNCVWSVSPP